MGNRKAHDVPYVRADRYVFEGGFDYLLTHYMSSLTRFAVPILQRNMLLHQLDLN